MLVTDPATRSCVNVCRLIVRGQTSNLGYGSRPLPELFPDDSASPLTSAQQQIACA